MEIQKIPLSLVSTSPMNPRKTFDEGDLQELADNIEKQGLLQPITVRTIKDAKEFAVVNGNADFHPKYEIICGERRFRAFSKLNDKWKDLDAVSPDGYSFNRFSEISAIVREMDDEEAFIAMITENLQRKNVDPIEEAFAFGQLIQKGKTVEEVAAMFGKSVRFVQDRVKLNGLIPELMLALKDEKMSISAAMMIAKLAEEDQRKFYSQYQHNSQGYSKNSAEYFLNNLFLTIDKSLWYQSDDETDKGFAGGCGCSCSECVNNTANHGCLFWEMKNEGASRCTDRTMFESKTIAFMLSEIDRMGDQLVKKGEPLAYGKTVICIDDDKYETEDVKNVKDKVRTYIGNRGLEIVGQSMFRSKCWYKKDDERLAELLENGEVYPCLELFDWRTPCFRTAYWYLKKNDVTSNSVEGKPFQVNTIIAELKGEEERLKYAYSTAEAETLNKCTPSSEPLNEEERVLLLCCMLTNNYSLAEKIGMVTSQATDTKNLHQYVIDHPEKWAMIMSGWMFQQINGSHPNLKIAEPMLDSLGEKHCPEEYQKAKDKVLAKFNKSKSKAEKKLKELGYGLDGEPLEKTETKEIPKDADLQKLFKEKKKKHPDAVILFRVGDFYECFHEDAEKVGEVLNLTVTKTKKGKLAGFPEHALDNYLKRLIKAKVKVAICEELEELKKKKK